MLKVIQNEHDTDLRFRCSWVDTQDLIVLVYHTVRTLLYCEILNLHLTWTQKWDPLEGCFWQLQAKEFELCIPWESPVWSMQANVLITALIPSLGCRKWKCALHKVLGSHLFTGYEMKGILPLLMGMPQREGGYITNALMGIKSNRNDTELKYFRQVLFLFYFLFLFFSLLLFDAQTVLSQLKRVNHRLFCFFLWNGKVILQTFRLTV